MPRKRKAQPVRAPAEQAYGAKNEQMVAQRQMPLPDLRSIPAPPAAPAPSPPGPPAAGGAAPSIGDVAAAMPMPNITGLEAPSLRPDEPVTAGAPIGPGPGPEALGLVQPRRPDPTVETLSVLASTFGSPGLAQLLESARRRRM